MRRTHDQVRVETRIEERGGVLALARKSRDGTAVHLRAGRISAEAKSHIDQAVDAFAEKVAIGLHVESETPNAVRDAMRATMKEMAIAPKAVARG